MSISKVRWNLKGTKIILSDKTHSIIALPGYEFMQLAQQPSKESKYEQYLGNTASKLLYSQANLLDSSPSFSSKF